MFSQFHIMLKGSQLFLISIFHISILSGQFRSADVAIDDRLLRSDEKHEIINLENDVQNFFLNTVWDDNYSDLEINLIFKLFLKVLPKKGTNQFIIVRRCSPTVLI